MKTKAALVLTLVLASATLATALYAGTGLHLPPPRPKGPCDIYAAAGDPCTATYSTTRAMHASYNGPFYQVKRQSEGRTLNIDVAQPAASPVPNAGRYADAAAQDAFRANTYCWITRIYDQSPKHNDLTQAPRGTFGGPAMGGFNNVPLTGMAPIMVMGHKVYGVFIEPGMGLRDDDPKGTAKESGTFAGPVAPGARVSATLKVTSGPGVFNGDLVANARWTNAKSGRKQFETVAEKVRNVRPVRINEFRIRSGPPANSTDSFIELYKDSAHSVDISNWTLTERPARQAVSSMRWPRSPRSASRARKPTWWRTHPPARPTSRRRPSETSRPVTKSGWTLTALVMESRRSQSRASARGRGEHGLSMLCAPV